MSEPAVPERPVAVLPVREGRLSTGASVALRLAEGAAYLVGDGASLAAEHVELADLLRSVEVEDFRPAATARAPAPLIEAARYIVLPADADGRLLAAQLAFVLRRPLISNVIYADRDKAVSAGVYGQITQTVAMMTLTGVITVAPEAELVEFSLRSCPRRTRTRVALPDVADPRTLGLVPSSAHVLSSGNARGGR